MKTLLLRGLNWYFKRFHPSNSPPSWFLDFAGSQRTSSGVIVTPETALTIAAFYSGVTRIAETIATLPLQVLEIDPENGARTPARNLSIFQMLALEPNPEMTAAEFREMMMGHVLLRGNGIAEIVKDGGSRIRQLWPLNPDRVNLFRAPDRSLWYVVDLPSGGQAKLKASDVVHFKAFGENGLWGMSIIRLFARTLGLSIAAEEYGSGFFGNGARLSGVLQYPGKLGDKAYNNLRDSFEKAHTGLTNAHRVAILEEGLTWKEMGVAPNEAQFLETRKLGVSDVARILKMPGHLLNEDKSQTFASVEARNTEYIQHTIRPWLVKIEQALRVKLLSPTQRQTHTIKHNVSSLLRGDVKTRHETYRTGRQWGYYSPNDVRRFENLNPIPPEEGGDTYLAPLNMVPAGDLPDLVGTGTASGAPSRSLIDLLDEVRRPENDVAPELRAKIERRNVTIRKRVEASFRHLFRDVETRITKREAADIRRNAKKLLDRRGRGDLEAWLRSFYRDHEGFVRDRYRPAVGSLIESVARIASEEVGAEPLDDDAVARFSDDYTRALAQRHTGSSLGQISRLIADTPGGDSELFDAIDKRLGEWEERRPGKMESREPVQAGSAGAKLAFAAAGIRALRWRTFGDNCPYCDKLDGTRVRMNENFIDKNGSLSVDGIAAPLLTKVAIGHPPAHGGCDCGISPA